MKTLLMSAAIAMAAVSAQAKQPETKKVQVEVTLVQPSCVMYDIRLQRCLTKKEREAYYDAQADRAKSIYRMKMCKTPEEIAARGGCR